MNFNNQPWEIFDTIIKESTWGSSEAGGPVWVMDFRLKKLKKRFPEHWWIKSLPDNLDDIDVHNVGQRFQLDAEKYILYHRLCNVLVITDCLGGGYARFYSLLSFCNLFNYTQKRGRTKGGINSPLLRYILYSQSRKIAGNDYVWYISWDGTIDSKYFPFTSIDEKTDVLPYPLPSSLTYEDVVEHPKILPDLYTRKFKGEYKQTVVKVVDNFEAYLVNTVYDLMELVAVKFSKRLFSRPESPCAIKLSDLEKFFLYEKHQYPLFCYNDETVKECPEYGLYTSYMEFRPQPVLPNVSNIEAWHRDFVPKHYWEVLEM